MNDKLFRIIVVVLLALIVYLLYVDVSARTSVVPGKAHTSAMELTPVQ